MIHYGLPLRQVVSDLVHKFLPGNLDQLRHETHDARFEILLVRRIREIRLALQGVRRVRMIRIAGNGRDRGGCQRYLAHAVGYVRVHRGKVFPVLRVHRQDDVRSGTEPNGTVPRHHYRAVRQEGGHALRRRKLPDRPFQDRNAYGRRTRWVRRAERDY